MTRHPCALLPLAVLCAVSVSCARPAPVAKAALIERSHQTMGSELRLTAWSSNERSTLSAFESVFAEFDRLDERLSVWKERSDVQQLNAAAGQHPVLVSPDTMAVAHAAR